jgi:hypothetical protein
VKLMVEWDREAAGIIQQRLESLRGAQQRQAMRWAISDTVKWAANRTIQGLSDAKRIQKKIIRRRVFAYSASARNLQGALLVTLGTMAAIYMGPARQTKTGVYVRSSGGQLSFPHAFIAEMPTGHIGIFRFPSRKYPPSRFTKGRKGKSPNLPIEEVRIAIKPEGERIMMALQSEAGKKLRDLVGRKIQQLIDSGKADLPE